MSCVISSCGFSASIDDILSSVISASFTPSYHICSHHYFPCFIPESILLILSRIDFAIATVVAILNRALTNSSNAAPFHILLFFSCSVWFSIYCALCSTAARYKWGSFARSPNLHKAVEQCLDWMCLALLSIVCCRTGLHMKCNFGRYCRSKLAQS